ncbi:hypothetical protein [Metabacillus litoralis]|uniref:hypothetical protein n=1 Tax=Metabacillus litoralis TaxID=152268 RepID=UPI00203ECD98|nr:hypothetical protein [Metabacillus litoralis]MCM3413564.1 hypothetical protein [Metabacillus litoralis]
MEVAIALLNIVLENNINNLRSQWYTGRYEKLSGCPSYSSAKSIVEALHCLEKSFYGSKRTASVKDLINGN